MAETYGVFDIRKMPVDLLATLACGLREDSRIRVKVSDMNATPDMLMYATMIDRLSLIAWLNSRDGAKGKNRPKSMLEMIIGSNKERNEMVFASGKDFEEYRKQFEEKYGTENDRQGVCPDPTDNDRDRGQDAKPAKAGGGKGRRRRRRKRGR